jgi:hypothetical protein
MLVRNLRSWQKIDGGSIEGHQVGCLFWNAGDRFENVSPYVGLTTDWDGRAAALIDFDNNGTQDLVVTTQDGPPRNGLPHLLRNEIPPRDHWISFSLVGTRSNRDVVGAWIEVSQGGSRWYRWATGGRTGLMASSDPRLHFGIPAGGRVDVRVHWPAGGEQRFSGVATGAFYRVVEGQGLTKL